MIKHTHTPIGVAQTFALSGVEYEQAHRWVLKNQSCYNEWESNYEEDLRSHTLPAGRKSGTAKVSIDELIPWLKNKLQSSENSNADFADVVNGPRFFAKRYKKCCVNGFLFVTKDYEENKRNQNSGVSIKASTTFRSSAKDKSPIDEEVIYYG